MIKISQKMKSNILRVVTILITAISMQILIFVLQPQLLDPMNNFLPQVETHLINFVIIGIVFYSIGYLILKNKIWYWMPVIYLIISMISHQLSLMSSKGDGIGVAFSIIFYDFLSKSTLIDSISLIPSSLIFLIMYLYNRLKPTKVSDDIAEH